LDEHTIEIDSAPAFYRAAPAAGAPPVLLHDLPSSSGDWAGLLERTGGIAPDLIGFGRSAKGGHLEYTINGLARFVSRLLGALELEPVRLAGHGWGALVALELAARAPERIERLALVSPLPLLAGHRWSGPAAIWRRPGVGELAMGALPKALLARQLRAACAHPEIWSGPRLDALWEQFDQGTQRAVLRLHRATDPEYLTHVEYDGPLLILHGERDPWCTPAQAEAIAAALPGAELHGIPDAGHWPWLEREVAAQALAAYLG
jgi:pimeloyl-ACP methyl ester carboxylesterase